MIKKNIVSKVSFYVSLLAFVAFASYILYISQEVFYTAHDRSEFIFGMPFFKDLLSKPFGLIQYVGAWLTQLFYYPALGTSVLIVIWTLIFLLGIKVFRLKASAITLMFLPIACLLTSVVDLGYWVYFIHIRGYFFSQSVGYLLMLLLLWAARSTPRRYHLVWYLVGLASYPVLGWFALVFILCLTLAEKISWRELVGFVLVLIAAKFWHAQLYSYLRYDQVSLAGLPVVKTMVDSSEYLSTPFWLLGAITVFMPLCAPYLNRWFVPLLCAVASICFICSLRFNDKTYIDEMRMVRTAEKDNWQEVLDIYSSTPKHTASMILLKNVALMHKGRLLDQSFKMGNIADNIYNPDSLHVSFLEIASPLVYYNYGMMNEAIRLSYENAVQEGLSPFYLKMLSRCTNATKEKKLETRFNSLLHHHPFYKDWKPSPTSEKTKELQNCYPDEITGVEKSENYIINTLSLWYQSDSRLASEQSLFYSMIRCDSRRFWPSLRQYVKYHQNEEFPTHAQEAYIMYLDKAPEAKRMMVPVSQEIYDRYKKFWTILEGYIKTGKSQFEVADAMHDEFGDTFWYYNIFNTRRY